MENTETSTIQAETPVTVQAENIGGETLQAESNSSQNTETIQTPQDSNRSRYEAIQAKIKEDPNMRFSPEELSFILDVEDGKIKLEDGEPNTSEETTTITDPSIEEAELAQYENEFSEIEKLLGVEDITQIPKKIKEITETHQTQLSQLNSRVQENEQIFSSMETLMDGLANGDPAAIARYNSIRGKTQQQTNVGQKSNVPEFDPQNALDAEAAAFFHSKLSKLEESVGKVLGETQMREQERAQAAAQSQAQKSVTDEITTLVEKFPTYGLKPAQAREQLDQFFKTGQVNPQIKPLVDLIGYTIKYNNENKVQINLDIAHKLKQVETEGERTAAAIREANKKLVSSKATKNTLAGADNKSKNTNMNTAQDAILAKFKADPGYKMTPEELREFGI